MQDNKAMIILRRSTHTFLTHIHHFSSTPTLLVLPFSLSLLLHLHFTAAISTLHDRLDSALSLVGFPFSSPTSNFLLQKLSQTLYFSFSSFHISFFLLLSKSSTINTLENHSFSFSSSSRFSYSSYQNPPTSAISSFFNLLITHICNLVFLIATNSACFTLLCLATSNNPTPTWVFTLSSAFYSVTATNTIVISNLALISSVLEGKGGFRAIIKACELVNRNTANALIVALPAKLAMTGVEVVFWYRIYAGEERWVWAVAAEVVLIGYIYSVLIVWDTIIGYFFYRSCIEDAMKDDYACDLEKLRALEEGF